MEIRLIPAAATYDLRHRVLWPDQPAAYVELPEDAAGWHYGAFEDGQLRSVVSLFVDGEVARFRKFATEPAWQGRGIGSALLRHMMQEAAEHGARRLCCDARQEKAGFYQKFGFGVEGEPFYKGPIPYVRMSCALPAAG
ncbi:GNAT family N-acetyltransferase [Hymenobacter jeollabukensis]|uniref:GNAT family N-acetyltransferase n=1 Tax=Hymenobacter jeollabukensis TaxID=2025313 RepID=A0A5R8WMI0_9BACT|nr:GNAT family N-acetyltransferase [Hymenobacter jeollabukensis]TLM90593.1 GNAT family N-acetyltransferase [Hymenobacter jeollabukensis]